MPLRAIAPQEIPERTGLVANSGAIAPVTQPGSLLARTGKAALLVRQHLKRAIAGALTLPLPPASGDRAIPPPTPQTPQNSSTLETESLKPLGAIAPYSGLTARGPAAAISSLLQADVAYFFGDRVHSPDLRHEIRPSRQKFARNHIRNCKF